ncbi:MAG: AlbA family DNA-binding domain-containing protein [Candidatus Helarchaeota archaeon]
MSSFFMKDIEDLNFSDIKDLVDRKIPESSVLDYKEIIINSDKIGKYIAAFANGSGGYIIIGISEEKKNGKNTGKPGKIIGVEKRDYTNLITNISIGQTHPSVIPQINDKIIIPNNPNKIIVIIKIKESLRPIMWKNRWPIRINDQVVYADNSLMKKLFNKEKYILEKRLQNIYDNIKRLLNEIKIDSHTVNNNYKTDFYFKLKKSINHHSTDISMLDHYQKKLKNYIKSFKEDWKYFGIYEENDNIYFCFGKYGLFNRLIKVPSHFPISKSTLIDCILLDLKEICKEYYQIDLA